MAVIWSEGIAKLIAKKKCIAAMENYNGEWDSVNKQNYSLVNRKTRVERKKEHIASTN